MMTPFLHTAVHNNEIYGNVVGYLRANKIAPPSTEMIEETIKAEEDAGPDVQGNDGAVQQEAGPVGAGRLAAGLRAGHWRRAPGRAGLEARAAGQRRQVDVGRQFLRPGAKRAGRKCRIASWLVAPAEMTLMATRLRY